MTALIAMPRCWRGRDRWSSQSVKRMLRAAPPEVMTPEILIDAGQGARFGVRTYKCPADAFLSGSMSDCIENGFVKNATQPEATAALRTAGSSLPVM